MVRNLTDLERPEVLKLYNDLKDFVEDLVIPAEAEFEEEMSRLSGKVYHLIYVSPTMYLNLVLSLLLACLLIYLLTSIEVKY